MAWIPEGQVTFSCSSGTIENIVLEAGLVFFVTCVSGTLDCHEDQGCTVYPRPPGATSSDAIRVRAKKTEDLKKS